MFQTFFSEQFGSLLAPYYIIQVLLIPVSIFIFALYKNRKVVKHTQSLISKINVKNIKIKIKTTSWHYLFLFILVILGVLIMLSVKALEMNYILAIVLGFVYGIYLIVLQVNFSKRTPSYLDIKKQIVDREHRELAGELTPEANDEEIINLEVNLKAENERMNAYIIEAALLGALAFSGYLGLVSSGNFSSEIIGEFNFHFFSALSNFIDPTGENISNSFSFLFSKDGILIMLSYQSLFCSIFFLAVIASRLRFSKLTDYIDRYLQLSKAMNDKEESLLINDKTNTKAINFYNNKIKNLLQEGYKKQDELIPIMEYMQFFRTLGIVMFFIIIITGGLFISPWISMIMAFISLLSMFYFYIGKFKTAIKSLYISMQEFYYRFDTKVHWVCWSMIIAALFMRTFEIPGGTSIMVLGFLFLFLHYLMNLIIPLQFDYEIKNKDDVFGTKIKYNKFTAYLFKISLALFFLGYMFKAMLWPGANAFLLISFLGLIVYFLICRKSIKQDNRIFDFIIGTSIAVVLVGVFFKLMSYPFATILLWIGIPSIYISAVLIYRKRKNVRAIIKRTILILCILSIATYSGYIRSALWNLSFNSKLIKKIENVKRAKNVFYIDNNHTKILGSEDIGVDSLKKVIKNFNKEYVFTEIIDSDILNELAWDIYKYSDDSIMIKSALVWSKITVERDYHWGYIDTYAALLYKNKMYEEAKINAEKAYELGKDESTKKLIQSIDSVLNIIKRDTVYVE